MTSGRTKSFTDRYPWVGPTVYILSILYLLAQIAVGWVWHPPYSVIHNSISDLGNTVCGIYCGADVCSPRHGLMNAAFIFLGVVMAVGSLLIYQEFTERKRLEQLAALVGFVCLSMAGLGSILVGLFPENTIGYMHITGAALAIGVGNIGVLVLGLGLTLPEGLRNFMLLIGIFSTTALICFACHQDFGIGAGGMERIAAYPQTFWLIRFGLYMSTNHFVFESLIGDDRLMRSTARGVERNRKFSAALSGPQDSRPMRPWRRRSTSQAAGGPARSAPVRTPPTLARGSDSPATRHPAHCSMNTTRNSFSTSR